MRNTGSWSQTIKLEFKGLGPSGQASMYIFFKLSIYLFLAVLCLCCCVRAFSSWGEQGLLFVAVRMLLITVASLIAEHGL